MWANIQAVRGYQILEEECRWKMRGTGRFEEDREKKNEEKNRFATIK